MTIIIGGGPGGYELAALLARKKEPVTLIERADLGGTCLNRGCIPTKVMAHAALLARQASAGAAYGINTDIASVDFEALCAKRSAVIEQLRQGVEMLMQGVEVVKGEARFVGAKEIAVGDRSLSADRIVIATGSAPALLPIPGAETALTSDSVLSINTLPASMIIIGGGVIGMEYASIFSALGVEVTVVEYCKEILPPFDKDIAKRLRMTLSQTGIKFVTGAEVTAIKDGHKVSYRSGVNEAEIEAEAVVMAVGRRPVFPAGLELTGVGFDRRGIKVDTDTFETSVGGIYAIGDVNGVCMLAHAASAQARVVAGESVDAAVIPSVVFTHPEAAMVGLTEQQCKDQGMAILTSKALFRGNGKAVTMDETSGMVKLIVDAVNRKILGCHILGPHAADLIMEPTAAMVGGLTVDSLTRTIHPHPTLSEAFLQACQTLR